MICRGEIVSEDSLLGDEQGTRHYKQGSDVHGRWMGILRPPPQVDIIVGMDGALRAGRSADHLDRAVRNHLVSVHAGLGARTPLPRIKVENSRSSVLATASSASGSIRSAFPWTKPLAPGRQSKQIFSCNFRCDIALAAFLFARGEVSDALQFLRFPRNLPVGFEHLDIPGRTLGRKLPISTCAWLNRIFFRCDLD